MSEPRVCLTRSEVTNLVALGYIIGVIAGMLCGVGLGWLIWGAA